MNALCLDLGTRWGWARLVDGCVVDSGEEDLLGSLHPLGARWLMFQRWLDAALDEWQPDAVLFEVPHGRYVNVLKIQFGMATIVELTCERRGLEYAGLRPAQMKGFATGKGNASKAQMMTALLNRYAEFGLPAPPPDMGGDECDAIWIALYAAAVLAVRA